MPEFVPPRIRVALPGGQDIPGQLIRWRQDPATGQWWAEVAINVPAAAVQQVPGEDYTHVPRQPADPRHVLATDTRPTPPTAELHLATCWGIKDPPRWLRITPMLDGVDGPDLLKFPDTTRCPLCLNPGP